MLRFPSTGSFGGFPFWAIWTEFVAFGGERTSSGGGESDGEHDENEGNDG